MNYKHIYIRGDIHGNIKEVRDFAYKKNTSTDDMMIVLGDAGFNYYMKRDIRRCYYLRDDHDSANRKLRKIPLTIAVVQGNHECPAWLCEGMKEIQFCGGTAYQPRTAPNVIYLKNGEIYTINGMTFLCMGGAYTIDKCYRSVPYVGMVNGSRWFPEEQMTDEEFEIAWRHIQEAGYCVDYVLTHTCPASKMPHEMLLDGVECEDNRMEEIFEMMYPMFQFKKWFFGHYHTDRWIDEQFRVLYQHAIELDNEGSVIENT